MKCQGKSEKEENFVIVAAKYPPPIDIYHSLETKEEEEIF